MLSAFTEIRSQTINTYAGGYGYGNALNAELNGPTGIYIDTSGNIYISDGGNNIIRKITPNGASTIIAGNGCSDYNSNDMAANLCQMYEPVGITADLHGNIYICDNAHSVLCKIDSTGFMTTIAGTGVAGYNGDNILATAAQLYDPAGVAVDDSGNIFIADEVNNRVRKISQATGIITTIAGTGAAGNFGDNGLAINAKLHGPFGLTIDHGGNIFIADLYNNVIRKIDNSGIISTVAGNGIGGYSGDNGPATSAKLFNPTAVAVDGTGNLYIADNQNNAVRKVTTDGKIHTVAGTGTVGFSGDNGPATAAKLNQPMGVFADNNGNLFITDQFNNRVRRVDPNGIITTYAGPGVFSGDNSNAKLATLNRPHGVTSDAMGNIYISDAYNSRIRKVNIAGIISTIAGTGVPGYNGDHGPAIAAQLYMPAYITSDHRGNLYFVDTNNVVRKIDTAGIITTVAGNGTAGFGGDNGSAIAAQLNGPNGVTVDLKGNLYISDYFNNRVRIVDTAGMINTFTGTGIAGYNGDNIPASQAQIGEPMGVSSDAQGNIYIADHFNYRVRKVIASGASAGNIITIAGNGICGYTGDGDNALLAQVIPQGITSDSWGNIFIVDQFTGRVREVDTSGIISHIAGTSSEDYGICGDGGIDSLADLSNPTEVAIDDSGKIYIADEFINRIRIITKGLPVAVPGIHNSSLQQITVYPNPANALIQIKTPLRFGKVVIGLSDILGSAIRNEYINNSAAREFSLDVSNIPNGMYILTIKTENGFYNTKVMVLH